MRGSRARGAGAAGLTPGTDSINRAALDCKWSPDGKKFAVASGAKCVPVCSYEQQNDWWISRIIKKGIRSSVLGVAWHPSSHLVATASSDFRARIYSAHIPEVDGSGVKTIICGDTASTGFGDLLAEFAGSNGWVEGAPRAAAAGGEATDPRAPHAAVSFSFNGFALAYVGHDATLNICTWDEKNPTAEPNQESLKELVLPSTKVVWLSDQIIVTAGHDFRPFVYQHPGPNRGSWKFLGSLDKEPDAKKDAPAPAAGDQTGFAASKSLWTNKTVKAQDTSSSQQDSAELWTKHANTIVDMKILGDTVYSTKVDTLSTAGLDGRVVVWKAKGALPNLAL